MSLLLLLLLLFIWSLSTLKNRDFRRSEVTRDGQTDGRTDEQMEGRMDEEDLLKINVVVSYMVEKWY